MKAGPVVWVVLAVFAQESVWNFYDSQVPAQLRQYLTSAGLIGLIMGMDNLLGVLVQPWMGNVSDRRAGGRRGRWPLILAGAAVAAVPFALIPWTNSLPLLLVCIVGFALTANAFKGITETLVSDYVDPGHRSKAQGFIKAGVSLTIVVSSLISLLVVDRSLELAFAIPAVLMVILFAVSWAFLGRRHSRYVRPERRETAPEAESPALVTVVKELIRDPSGSRLLLMAGVFCFAGMWSALRTLLTPYGTEVLGLTRGAAGGLSLPGAIAFLIGVVPIAYASTRLGQFRAIRYGLVVFLAGLLVGYAAPNTAMTVIALALCSIGYAAFAVNALVALWNLAPSDHVLGTYTGLYTVASASGMALGPALLGVAVDLTGWRHMFLDAAVFAAVTLFVFGRLTDRHRTNSTDLEAS
ncbi:MFS transporter [Kribbella sp.]|uniref:MFS transporter n=1 Tax=Kribbella sp. TaxID=1871183 RepID=UPI002D313D6F|nr:MFS transporter [Kribbella sp.]HZX03996.1 MFS transporter [Kribbella sp.]